MYSLMLDLFVDVSSALLLRHVAAHLARAVVVCCRFSDGKINEAVVWEGVPPGERHRIPDLAVQYILLRHLPPGTVVQSGSTALDPLLYPANSSALKGKSAASAAAAADVTWQEQQRQQQGQPGSTTGVTAAGAPSVAIAVFGSAASTDGAAATETAASRAADAALNQLGKQLRGLSDLALKVIGVQPLSSVTRHTCCFYPKPHPLAEGAGFGVYEGAGDDKVPRVLEPIEVMIQLEGSGGCCSWQMNSSLLASMPKFFQEKRSGNIGRQHWCSMVTFLR
jgi:hypothetical protein